MVCAWSLQRCTGDDAGWGRRVIEQTTHMTLWANGRVDCRGQMSVRMLSPLAGPILTSTRGQAGIATTYSGYSLNKGIFKSPRSHTDCLEQEENARLRRNDTCRMKVMTSRSLEEISQPVQFICQVDIHCDKNSGLWDSTDLTSLKYCLKGALL